MIDTAAGPDATITPNGRNPFVSTGTASTPGSGAEAAPVDAIVLAGGRGSRLGGVDKAALELDDRRLVDRAVAAARDAGAARVIVAGPPHAGALADAVVREDPPFSGPLSALAAALGEVRAPWIMLLACDLVHPDEIAAQLRETLHGGAGTEATDGLILLDGLGEPQWLAACIRADALRVQLDALPGGPDGRPLRAALAPLALRRIPARAGTTDDIDTHEQLARARAASAQREEEAEP